MELTRTIDATVEPVTLAEAKAQLRVNYSDHDTLIAGLITTARTDCENRLRRSLIDTTWTFTLDCFHDVITLPMPNLISVTSLKYYDEAGTQQTLANTAYRAAANRLQPVDEWPMYQDRIGAVEVVYKAGYGTTADKVPTPIKQWILLSIEDLFTQTGRSAEKPVVPQDFADHLLDRYRVWRP